jgi:hypothetical protein
MSESLVKPDEAHQPQLAAELKARAVMLGLRLLYVAGAVLTLLYQLVIRLEQCTGTVECSISIVKAFVWMAVWPFYWIFYINGGAAPF